MRFAIGFGALALALLWAAVGCELGAVQASEAFGTALRAEPHPGLGTLGGIAQTSDGFLWFGGRNGLRRFDGVEERDYYGPPGVNFAAEGVHGILAASNDELWVATGEGILGYGAEGAKSLYCDKRGRGALVLINKRRTTSRVVAAAQGLQDAWIWSIKEDAASNIWVGTDKGLGVVRRNDDPNKRRIERVPCADLSEPITVAEILVRGDELWLATDRGVFVKKGERCDATAVVAPALSLAQGAKGEIYVATEKGLIEIRAGSVRRFSERDGMLPVSIYKVLGDADGSVWVGTGDELIVLDSQKRFHRPGADGGAINIFKDDEGSLWYTTTARGVVQLSPAIVTMIRAAREIGSPMVFAVHEARDGSVWFTTPAGITHLAGGRTEHYAHGKEIPVWSVRSMAESAQGGLWFTVEDGGLLLREGETFKHFPVNKFPELDRISSVAVARDGALWVGHRNGSVVRFSSGYPGSVSQAFSVEAGVCSGRTMAVAESADGTMWWGTSAGLTQIKNHAALCFSNATGLPSNDISALHPDPSGGVWLGTRSDAGLVHFQDGRAQALGAAIGFPAGGVFGIVEDRNQNLWWSSARGIYRASKQELMDAVKGKGRALHSFGLGVRDGLNTELMSSAFAPAAFASSTGLLLFASLEGLAVIDPSKLALVSRARPVIDRIRLNGREYEPSGPVTTAPGKGDIELLYTAPSSQFAHRLRFLHLLEGFETAWVEAGGRRTAYYANLKPGRYRFRVRCIDDQGVVSQNEDSLVVVVPPLYYQTIWFRVLAGCAALICLAALYRKRIRALQERSRLVHAERDRIARDLHDHLGQGLGAIGYLSDAIAMSEDALPARTHDLLGKLRRVVEQTNHGVNDLIWNLRQVGVDPSLDVALQPVAERARDMGVTVRLDIPKGIRASSLHIHEIPFVVQEAITNAYKHGRSTSVVVSAEQNQRMLEIRVADDGTGMKVEQSAAGRGGFGVMGMHERARRMHGDLTFEKNEAAGEGTVVVLRVPVDPEAT